MVASMRLRIVNERREAICYIRSKFEFKSRDLEHEVRLGCTVRVSTNKLLLKHTNYII